MKQPPSKIGNGVDAIRTLRAQLAKVQAELVRRVDMHECAMAERDDATLYGAEQTGGKMEILETRTKATRDDWGFPGVATYNRLSDFNHGGFAHVRMSDTSSGHGWAGTMHRNEWEAIK